MEAQAPRVVLALTLLCALAGCRNARLREVRPSIDAVLLALGEPGGVDVFVGTPISTGDPFTDMHLDAAAQGTAEALAGRIDAVVPQSAVEDAAVAAVRGSFADAIGAPLVDARDQPHDAVFAVSVPRWGLYASDLNAPLEWYVEARATLTYAPTKEVVWDATVRERVPATPAAVVGGGGGSSFGVVAELPDEQILDVVLNLSGRAGRALVRRLRDDAR